jgi:hypothetical protein
LAFLYSLWHWIWPKGAWRFVFWDVTQCSLADKYWCFEWTCYFQQNCMVLHLNRQIFIVTIVRTVISFSKKVNLYFKNYLGNKQWHYNNLINICVGKGGWWVVLSKQHSRIEIKWLKNWCKMDDVPILLAYTLLWSKLK